MGDLAKNFLSPKGRKRCASAIEYLQQHYGPRCSTGQAIREQHGRGEALDAGDPPDAVIWPESTLEVSDIVSLCARKQVPVIAFGAGSSLEGHVSAPYGGICMDLSRMDQVLRVSSEDADCTVQAGVTREGLNDYLRDTGLFFPVDPGANATLGGMVSTRASGTTTVRYGAMPQHVLALQVVMANGHVIECGTRARKSSVGYDLVRLFTGSEGTLGIVTEITLRIHARPEAVGCLTCAFPSMREAVDAVTELSMTGLGLARIEFLDERQVKACNQYSALDLPESPMLFIELHGPRTGIEEQIIQAQEIAHEHGGGHFRSSTRVEDHNTLWRARHHAYFAALASRPGCEAMVTDVCVPISALADCIIDTRRDLDAAGLQAPILGHVGDGNFHVIFLLEPGDGAERERADKVHEALIARALSAGGTCSGEHGIGLGKRGQLIAEAGEEVVGLMQALKTAWDPGYILNPGKLFF